MPSASRCVRSLACRRRRWTSCCSSPTTRTIKRPKLLCTGKADPIIRKGHVVQNAFFKRLLDHVEPADQEVFFRTMELIGKNLDEIIKENA